MIVYSTIAQLVERAGARYGDLQVADDACRRAREDLRALSLAARGPFGLECFTDAALAHPGATYAVIDLSPEYVELREYEARLDQREVGLVAVDALTGEDLGAVGAWTFRAPKSAIDVLTQARASGCWSANSTEYVLVLPLSGCSDLLMQHPTAQRMQALALELRSGEALAAVLDAEDEVLTCERDLAALKAEAVEVSTLLALQGGALVSLLRGLDWTYEYADRVSELMREHERATQRAAHELSLDVAASTVVFHAGEWWGRMPHLLRSHPDLRRLP